MSAIGLSFQEAAAVLDILVIYCYLRHLKSNLIWIAVQYAVAMGLRVLGIGIYTTPRLLTVL